MKMLKRLFDFYINSSIHVALSVFSLTWITLLEYGISYDEALLSFVFFASISGYNFVKYFGIAKFHHRSLANWLKTIQIFSLLCFISMCYYVLQLRVNAMFFIVGLGLVTFFYAIPFLPKHLFLDSKNNLRNVGGLKVYLIALVWAGVTVFLPIINNDYTINADVVITGIQRFVFIIVLMLPFEIRDLMYDSLKLATIPQKIGVKQTKIIGVVLLGLFLFLEFFKAGTTTKSLLVSMLISVVISLFLLYSKKEQGTYYSSFWVEGLPVLWLFLMLLFK
ncbi:UbiA prenyltransferase family protein [Mariniflexile rhizosphaerae]|uniref:hypothetical protein n=1 Tax=unclassified Mariniflexile TaxID=2643887 RepID=UPI000CC957EF|nr:hypothetical protein [Mariniflexile sp. TRM1-10]PLB21066.1 MAG: Membrane protein [Flavobacteriaceae bacterium FS1-H7996/R]